MANDVPTLLNARRPEIDALLKGLERYLTPERLLAVALQAWSRTPGLRDCSPESLVGAVVKCAEMGLEPNTPLGHAYILPYRSKHGGTFAQVIVGYKGYIHLALMSGAIDDIRADIVCVDEVDTLQVSLLDPKVPLVHQVKPFGGIRETIDSAKPDRTGRLAGVAGAYAVAYLSNGLVKGWWSPMAEILKAYAHSEAAKSDKGPSGPWVEWTLDMYRKTPIRRLLSKGIRLTGEVAPRMAAALSVSASDYRIEPDAEPDDLPAPAPLKLEHDAPPETPQVAATRDEGAHRRAEPEQAPTPGSFAGLENRQEVIAKPRTTTKTKGGDAREPAREVEVIEDGQASETDVDDLIDAAALVGHKPSGLRKRAMELFGVANLSELRRSQIEALAREVSGGNA